LLALEWYFNKLGTAINAKPFIVSPNFIPIPNVERCFDVTYIIRGKTTSLVNPLGEADIRFPQIWSIGTCHITTLEPIMPKRGF